jgi:hypothetical protein
MLARVCVLIATMLVACVDAFAPDVGPRQSGACSDADGNPDVDVSFDADIGGVFERGGCLRCHQGGDASSSLQLDTYATLLEGGTHSGTDIVIAGQPCSSVLEQKIGPAPPFGVQMPRDRTPLSEIDRQLVHDWIAEGARDN